MTLPLTWKVHGSIAQLSTGCHLRTFAQLGAPLRRDVRFALSMLPTFTIRQPAVSRRSVRGADVLLSFGSNCNLLPLLQLSGCHGTRLAQSKLM